MVSQFQCRTNVGGSNFPCKRGPTSFYIHMCIHIFINWREAASCLYCGSLLETNLSYYTRVTVSMPSITGVNWQSDSTDIMKREDFGTFHEYSKTSDTGSLACTIPFKVALLARGSICQLLWHAKSLTKIYPAQISMNWMNTCNSQLHVPWVITISIV